jgi:uncharacterized protein YhaN
VTLDEPTRAFLHELERADEAVSATLAELDELAAAAEDVRTRALDLEAFGIRLPAERARLAAALVDAGRAADAAHATLARADQDVAEAERKQDVERVRAARRAEVRARDAVRMAERHVAELAAERDALEARAHEAAAEMPRLEARAAELAEALALRPRLAAEAGVRPGPGLAGIAEWGTQARAALFVARGGLAAERDAVIRQANELGSLVLGEPVAASSAAAIARRLESS